ncbi:MAG TPA: hypothetical protein ENF41_03395 [Candidatus Bathyarchaeota archaeon]|nr:hypothetical protein [Candidatus Bathyarchaeota archaeon]
MKVKETEEINEFKLIEAIRKLWLQGINIEVCIKYENADINYISHNMIRERKYRKRIIIKPPLVSTKTLKEILDSIEGIIPPNRALILADNGQITIEAYDSHTLIEKEKEVE